ncbi:hypothetical protein NPIL_317251 [Nephila pilipes]|uniref:Uncharacterized protein n=1 Tax=Nephila pilipes TaxID=299642 RepID=A0A8X6IAD7_NEPPI|nr:hypothetical protein NPIL_317251 [Nephila pilipes]
MNLRLVFRILLIERIFYHRDDSIECGIIMGNGFSCLLRTRNLPSAEFAGRKFISQDLTIAKLAPTKKVYVPCVGKNFWIPKTTSNRQPETYYHSFWRVD